MFSNEEIEIFHDKLNKYDFDYKYCNDLTEKLKTSGDFDKIKIKEFI